MMSRGVVEFLMVSASDGHEVSVSVLVLVLVRISIATTDSNPRHNK